MMFTMSSIQSKVKQFKYENRLQSRSVKIWEGLCGRNELIKKSHRKISNPLKLESYIFVYQTGTITIMKKI